MLHRIETIPSRKLIGMHIRMSLLDNRTAEVWRSFMPRRREIHSLTNDLFSMQVFGDSYCFDPVDPEAPFEKWAAVEVAEREFIPAGMESFELPGGKYAVYTYRGSSAQAADVFRYIFGTWLPDSGYILDNRPHFEILGERYRNNDPESEEEIWIPIREISVF